MSQPRIRPYATGDYQYTHDLHRENMRHYVDKYWGGWNSAIYKKDICPKITWIIEYKGENAGFFVLNFARKAHLKNIQINSSFQNKGLGSEVISHCERECIGRGFNTLYLEVFLDNPANKLYERLGYEIYKVTKSHYLMKKCLNRGAK